MWYRIFAGVTQPKALHLSSCRPMNNLKRGVRPMDRSAHPSIHPYHCCISCLLKMTIGILDLLFFDMHRHTGKTETQKMCFGEWEGFLSQDFPLKKLSQDFPLKKLRVDLFFFSWQLPSLPEMCNHIYTTTIMVEIWPNRSLGILVDDIYRLQWLNTVDDGNDSGIG